MRPLLGLRTLSVTCFHGNWWRVKFILAPSLAILSRSLPKPCLASLHDPPWFASLPTVDVVHAFSAVPWNCCLDFSTKHLKLVLWFREVGCITAFLTSQGLVSVLHLSCLLTGTSGIPQWCVALSKCPRWQCLIQGGLCWSCQALGLQYLICSSQTL